MKTLYSLLVCAVFVIFLAPDVKSAPIIDIDECTVCCAQMECLTMCDFGYDAHVSILNSIFLHDLDMCGGDMGCAMQAWATHDWHLFQAFNSLQSCNSLCLAEHP